MSTLKLKEITNTETADSTWKTLYKVGGTAALITAVFIPIQIIIFIVSPPPSSVIDWFTLFQNNRLVGLIDMDLLLVADNVLAIPIFLALYVALRGASKSIMTIATGLAFIGIAAYFSSNTAFNMLSISNQYATATTEAQRSMFLAAGQAMLANYTGTAFQFSYVLGAVAFIIISVVMLRSNIFSKVTAYLGIAANIIALGLYIPTIGVYISVFSVLFLWIWYILITRRLFQLGRAS